MHINQKKDNTFKPVKLEITIESMEELLMIREMCSLNITLPKAIQNSNPDKGFLLSTTEVFLENMSKALRDDFDAVSVSSFKQA